MSKEIKSSENLSVLPQSILYKTVSYTNISIFALLGILLVLNSLLTELEVINVPALIVLSTHYLTFKYFRWGNNTKKPFLHTISVVTMVLNLISCIMVVAALQALRSYPGSRSFIFEAVYIFLITVYALNGISIARAWWQSASFKNRTAAAGK